MDNVCDFKPGCANLIDSPEFVPWISRNNFRTHVSEYPVSRALANVECLAVAGIN